MGIKEHIALQIRRFRKEMGVTMAALGKLLDPPRSGNTIQSWEIARTQPDADTLIQLCQIFGKDIRDFYSQDAAIKDAEAETCYTDDEVEILGLFRGVNAIGRGRIIEYVQMMTKSEMFTRSDDRSSDCK